MGYNRRGLCANDNHEIATLPDVAVAQATGGQRCLSASACSPPCLSTFATPTPVLGQRRSVTWAEELAFHQATTRALAHGAIEEAETLVASRPADDPAAAAVRARILISRGGYQEAEQLLAPIAAANPWSDAALELGLLHMYLGRKAEAADELVPVIQAGSALSQPVALYRAGRAARALDQFRQANSYFRRAASVAAGDPAIHAAWGDLFLEKYNYPDAVRSYNDAVGIDNEWAPAHLGLARALADENPPAAHAAAERALAIDPSDVAAHLFVAELALDAVRPADGRAAIERALEVNPSSLEARALLAGTAYVEDRVSDFDAEVARMLAINPVYGDAYRVAGALAARNYRFEEAVVLLRRAVELESDNTRAHAELGLHLLRTGDEPAAREALERAFAADPFDVVTFNLLQLLDTLDGLRNDPDRRRLGAPGPSRGTDPEGVCGVVGRGGPERAVRPIQFYPPRADLDRGLPEA